MLDPRLPFHRAGASVGGVGQAAQGPAAAPTAPARGRVGSWPGSREPVGAGCTRGAASSGGSKSAPALCCRRKGSVTGSRRNGVGVALSREGCDEGKEMRPGSLSAAGTGNEIAGLSSHGKEPSTLHREGPI